MRISKILVPMVALTATNNYVIPNNQVTATCEEVCAAGFAACSEKCALFGWLLPGGTVACELGCAGVFAGCLALCGAASR